MVDDRVASLSEFRLPSLGADMDEARILEWRVRPGDEVRRGDVVALIDTEKSEIDLEIWHGGVIAELVVAEGELVPVGTVLARLQPADTVPETTPEPAVGPAAVTVPAPRVVSPLVRHLAEQRHLDPAAIAGSGLGGRVRRRDVEAAEEPRPIPTATPGVRASPRARRLAAELGLDLGQARGTGPGGAIVAADLESLRVLDADLATGGRDLRQVREVEGDGERPARGPRHAIAEIMARSNREVPHYFVATEIDVTRVMADVAATNERRSVADRLLAAAPLLVATARALARHPELNGFWRNGAFEPSDGVHLGVAVSKRGGGLVAPAISHAESLDIDDMMRALSGLVTRARAGRLRSSELASPTVTVTSLGDRGPTLVLPVIYPPQVAMIGFGRIAERPCVVAGEVRPRSIVTASLAGDHRATDGDRGARFLATLATVLEHLEVP